MKRFHEALKDGFKHITEVSDPILLKSLRDEGVLVDTEGYWSFSFGEHKEYEWRVLPAKGERNYYFGIYKNGVLLNEKLLVWVDETSA